MMRALLITLLIGGAAYAAGPRATPDQLGPAWKSGIYTYDGAGNISAIGTDQYRYDAMSRLTAAPSAAYHYDPYGNMSDRAVDGNNHRYGSGIRYDEAGNLVEAGGEQYSYDASGMMIAKEHDTPTWHDRYLYTADDQRVGVRSGDTWTWTFRDGGHDVARQYKSSYSNPAASWTWVEDYVYGPRGMVAAERTGGRRHFHVDHLRTPRLITDRSGASIAQHDYTPFGVEPVAQGEEVKKFTGHERDVVADGLPNPQRYLDYMHARYYDPHEARFLSVDPGKDSDPSRPQSWNRYAYVGNGPMTLLDPTGMYLEFSFENRVKPTDVEQFINNHLHGETATVDKTTGNVTLAANDAVGPPSAEQKAFSDVLHAAVDRTTDTVRMTITKKDSDVWVGQYDTGKVDLADVKHFRAMGAGSAGSAFAHEVSEQTAKQIFGLPNGPAGFGLAHPFGIAAQSLVAGYARGEQKSTVNSKGTGVITTVHTNGSGHTVVVRVYLHNGNVVRVKP